MVTTLEAPPAGTWFIIMAGSSYSVAGVLNWANNLKPIPGPGQTEDRRPGILR